MTEQMNEIQKVTIKSRRAYERIPFIKRLTVLDVNTNRIFDANGIDISVKGVGFYSSKLFQKGHHVSIQIWLDDVSQKDPVWIGGTVKWSKLEQDGAIMGIEFDALIKPAEHPKLYGMIYKIMQVLLVGSGLL